MERSVVVLFKTLRVVAAQERANDVVAVRTYPFAEVHARGFLVGHRA